MDMYLALAIFAPLTVISIVALTMYIRVSTQKLYDEMRRRGKDLTLIFLNFNLLLNAIFITGLLLNALPVIIPYNVVVEEEIRSPITGTY